MAYVKKTVKTEQPTVESAKVEITPIDNKKIYEKDETIVCKSITNGLLLVTGEKSGMLYRWADYGDEEEIEYQYLIYMIRSKNPSVFKPRFVIENKDILEDYPVLKNLYNSLYSTSDLRDILKLPTSQMRKVIADLPSGAFDAIKGISASMIMDGSLDSVAKIKVLDEIFDTHLLLTLAQG